MKAYEIKNLSDLASIPQDKLDDFLADFKTWIIGMQEIGNSGLRTTKAEITWFDDGDSTVSIEITTNQLTSGKED